ncbi:hypothetical protein M3I54_16825 [Paraburkholderia sp. CNPSo 3274]|uniref:hypothetical protein n=1 Tax=Paraburkholderia sp. CNPSo 3274 TaxID=2940932 RepID=UPI0020B8E2CC|nr:hypothetical protein [Paraburkholderia sp. CNPSo 3274]MCP3708637.1 hypothetical protein [Paraburkholderia sp. CNPSo 3274]
MKQRLRLDRGRSVAFGSPPESGWVQEMALRGRHDGTAHAMLLSALVGSWSRCGSPVRIQGVFPGVSVLIEAQLASRPLEMDEVNGVVSALCEAIWPQMRDWCMIDPLPQEAVRLVVQDVVIHCAWDQYVSWLPGTMDIVVKDDPAASGAASAREWALKSRFSPRISRPAPAGQRPAAAPGPPGRTPVEEAIGHALQCLLRASAPEFISLPPPVRYRATGALDAWQAVWRASGREGAQFAARLRDPRYAPLSMCAALPGFIEAQSQLDLRSSDDGQLVMMLANMNCLQEVFWQRQGALYEPTAALHRLMEVSDIGHDVPPRLLRLPAKALCIIPPSCECNRPGGLTALTVFEHAGLPDKATAGRRLTVAAWQAPTTSLPSGSWVAHDMHWDDASATISGIQEASLRDWSIPEERIAFWRHALDYLVKMLLYLSLDHVPIGQDRAYSSAPREFAGLGKRRRQKRLAEIGRLYDRYIVGPGVLEEHNGEHGGVTGTGAEVRPHWRRGHFRMQVHGPGFAQRKLIFVMPMLVRADRLVGVADGG